MQLMTWIQHPTLSTTQSMHIAMKHVSVHAVSVNGQYVTKPTYRLAKEFEAARILNLPPGQTTHTVMSSTKFVGRLQEAGTRPEECWVSFDVTSLLSSGYQLAKHWKWWKQDWPHAALMDRTTMPIPQLVEYIKLMFTINSSLVSERILWTDLWQTHGIPPIPHHWQSLHGRAVHAHTTNHGIGWEGA